MLPGGLLLALLWRRPKRRFAGLAMLLAAAMLASLTGCANSLSTSSTPAGNYTFRIVGSGATSGATQSAAVALTVTN
jgi:hypothetical protein